jgi:hypothetical protein
MSSYASLRRCLSFEQALAPFHVDEGLPFANVLPVAVVEQVFADEGVAFGASNDSVFTPAVTLWAFLSQVLENDKSCRAAVTRVLASRVAAGQTPCSEQTGAYCRARAKLPATVLKRLALQTGRSLEAQVPGAWLWHGKHVTLVDGTTILLPDTPVNQAAYPQPSTQGVGVGFPILRMVVLLSLATACLLGMALAPYQGKETGETALLRRLLDQVPAGAVLLADRYYCTYWLVAMAQVRASDVVFRMHHRRDYDFRRGQRLGADDHNRWKAVCTPSRSRVSARIAGSPWRHSKTAPCTCSMRDQANALAIRSITAYIYGYPLITMEMSRRVMTNATEPKDSHAPIGEFYNAGAYPSAAFHDVSAPNADTLYSTAWLDLSEEPYVLSLPDEDGRYYLMPILSGWSDVVQILGTRTTGTKAQQYVIVGPNWEGELPKGVKKLRSPTSMVWIRGRTYCAGTPEDYKAVHALQNHYTLVPLSAYGKPYTPPHSVIDPKIDMITPVRAQVNRMDAATYFKLLAVLLKDNPPAVADAPMVAALAKIGIVPGQDFDLSKLEFAVGKGLERAPVEAQVKIMAHLKAAGTAENGWMFTPKNGLYGTDYLQRALIATIRLGANRPQDAVCLTSETDANGKPYTGAKQYVMHFEKGQTPPANAYWSMTMYDDEYFFAENPLNKYSVSPRNALKYNDDGSLDLYIQHESPGMDKEANWLPAPVERFILMLRMYWPKEKAPSIIDGSWKTPPVKSAP